MLPSDWLINLEHMLSLKFYLPVAMVKCQWRNPLVQYLTYTAAKNRSINNFSEAKLILVEKPVLFPFFSLFIQYKFKWKTSFLRIKPRKFGTRQRFEGKQGNILITVTIAHCSTNWYRLLTIRCNQADRKPEIKPLTFLSMQFCILTGKVGALMCRFPCGTCQYFIWAKLLVFFKIL